MRSQLAEANISNIGGNPWAAEYIYHDNGDMYKRTVTGKSEAAFTYVGNLMDTASGGESFDLDWDENGQLTAGASSESLVYNWDGKLRSATKAGTTINLKYDPYGNRIYKKSGSTERKYIVDVVGDLPVILLELDSTDTIQKTYIYGNSQILSQHDGNHTANRYFYLHDRLGSVRQIIDTSGNIVRLYTYEPFGQTLEDEGTLTNPFMFTGQFYDSEIDEYYLRARQYDPHIYRFTSRDPVLGEFKEPLTLHAYLYCINNPINRIDPAGLWGPAIHNQLIDETFLVFGLSGQDRGFIKEGSEFADIFQDPEDAYMHAMRAPDQSVEKAEELMWGFVEEHLYYYELYEFVGWHDEALFQLGMALHPIMDLTSPSHEGFQIWNGVYGPGAAIHWKKEREITPEKREETRRRMISTMWLYGFPF
jgi:RHS repeat-associated protein